MIYLLNLLIGFFILSSPVFAQGNNLQNELDIRIRTDKAVYRIGDLFIVYGSIKNLSDKPLYYNPGSVSPDFSPHPIVFDQEKKLQLTFSSGASGSVRSMGVLPDPELLIDPKGTYKFSIHGIIEKGNVVLPRDKSGENAIKTFGITIDFHSEQYSNILLSGPGRYFLKVSCALGPKDSGSYLHTDNFMSGEAAFEIRDEENKEPVNVQEDIRRAVLREDYSGGCQDILLDFYKEAGLTDGIKKNDPALYKEKYEQLVDKYLEVTSGYIDEISPKLAPYKEGGRSELERFLLRGSNTRRSILLAYGAIDPESAWKKRTKALGLDIKNQADTIMKQLESMQNDRFSNNGSK